MGAAAYNRASRVIRERIDGEPRVRSERCGGRFMNGPEKRYARCSRCRSLDYEANEGDRCVRIIEVRRSGGAR